MVLLSTQLPSIHVNVLRLFHRGDFCLQHNTLVTHKLASLIGVDSDPMSLGNIAGTEVSLAS